MFLLQVSSTETQVLILFHSKISVFFERKKKGKEGCWAVFAVSPINLVQDIKV